MGCVQSVEKDHVQLSSLICINIDLDVVNTLLQMGGYVAVK